MNRRAIPYLTMCLSLVATVTVAADGYAPVVRLSVTEPDGTTHQLTAAESRTATLTTADGTEYAFRPTIQDSRPWNNTVVTLFRTATADSPDRTLGQVALITGGPALDSQTEPSFRIAVLDIEPPPVD